MTYQELAVSPNIEARSYTRTESAQIPKWMRMFQLGLGKDPAHQHTLAYYLTNNTPCSINRVITVERPLSAYFSLNGKELLIELGRVGQDGTGKLHWYLNQEINYCQRVSSGYHLASGHFAKTNLGEIALLDYIHSSSNGQILKPEQANLLSALIENNILPLGSDGVPLLVKF